MTDETRYESHQWGGGESGEECVACDVHWQDCEGPCPGPTADQCYALPDGSTVLAPEPPSPQLVDALTELADAARRAVEADPEWPALVAKQAAAQERNRARLIRLRLREP